MAQRPKGCESIVMAADGAASADPKNVYALVITATGATAGDIVYLRNGSGGTIKAHFILPAAAGLWVVDFGRYGIEFISSVYYDEVVSATSHIWTTVIFG